MDKELFEAPDLTLSGSKPISSSTELVRVFIYMYQLKIWPARLS